MTIITAPLENSVGDRRAPPTTRLLGIATAVPRFAFGQAEVQARARHLFAGRLADFERLEPIYANAGVNTRYSCVPLDWYGEPHGWAERNRLYLENAQDLSAEAARSCLDNAGTAIDEVDAVVVVSTSGIATPSLDALLIERLSLRADVTRLPIFGLGCAGGVLGLARAAALAQSRPGHKVLFVTVELCGLTFRINDSSKSNMVATALFGDGAAALLLGTDGTGITLTHWGEHTWPGSLDVMGWRVENDGLGVLFSSSIPALVETKLRDAADRFLARHHYGMGDIAGVVAHPGGAKVLTALERAFDLPPEAFDHARDILRDYGNMSAASVLFVLQRTLEAGARGRRLMLALGPGFTAGFVILEL